LLTFKSEIGEWIVVFMMTTRCVQSKKVNNDEIIWLMFVSREILVLIFGGSTSVKGTDAIGLAATASNFPSSLRIVVELYSGAMDDVNVPVIQNLIDYSSLKQPVAVTPSKSFHSDSVSGATGGRFYLRCKRS
jgi:hypothetical protein